MASYTTPQSTANTTNPTPPDTHNSKFVWTEGWYVTIACVGGVLVANTRLGPFAFGILTIALIFQTTLLLEGK